jgi:hypothetical protein
MLGSTTELYSLITNCHIVDLFEYGPILAFLYRSEWSKHYWLGKSMTKKQFLESSVASDMLNKLVFLVG